MTDITYSRGYTLHVLYDDPAMDLPDLPEPDWLPSRIDPSYSATDLSTWVGGQK